MTTDDSDPDLDSVHGQAALLARTRAAIDGIGAVAASSPDDLVRVWVTAAGSVVDVELDEATRRLDRDELGRLITATAQQAAQNASAKVAAAVAELEQRRARVLQQLSDIDPDVVEALGEASAATRADPPSLEDDPFSFYQPLHDGADTEKW